MGMYEAAPEVKQKKVLPLITGGADSPLVLVVDDDSINREMLAQQVRLLGLRAETAGNGRIALSMWQEGHFSLVIIDCHMPEMDGYEFSREVRRREAEKELPRTPVVAWSGNALAEDEELCRQAGMDGFLVKPTRLKELRDLIATCLNIETTEGTDSEDKNAERTEAGPIDFDMLEKILPDRSKHMRVLHDFREHISIYHAELIRLLELDDLTSVENIAHRIKGGARMVGAWRVADACAAVEQSARDGDKAGAGEAKTELDVAVSQLETFLEGTGK